MKYIEEDEENHEKVKKNFLETTEKILQTMKKEAREMSSNKYWWMKIMRKMKKFLLKKPK